MRSLRRLQHKDLQEKNELLWWAAARGLLPDVSVAGLQPGLISVPASEAPRAATATSVTIARVAQRQSVRAFRLRTPQAQELVASGADPACKDKQGRAPAHYAAAHGHTAVLEFLATKGVDLDGEDSQGRGALHYAALGA